jgi:putative thioredoxin
MIDITLQNFQAELVEASMSTPVLLDIWAEWCGPCKQLGPVLEQLEVEYGGRFKLAKLDADKVPELAGQLSQMLGTRSIPLCVLFSGGQPVDAFVGAQPAAQVRQFLDKHVPPAQDEPEEEAAVEEGPIDPGAQLDKLKQALAANASDETARFDYVKALLLAGRFDEAQAAFAPVAAQATGVRRLEALQRVLEALAFARRQGDAAQALARFDQAVAANKRDFEARFGKARVLAGQRRWTDAMDELLEILMRDKAWNEDAARKTCIAILEVIEPPKPKVAEGQIPPEDPTVASYRRRLSSVVLS